MTSEVSSFAHYTMTVRIPHIIDETVQLNTYPADLEWSLHELKAELLTGRIRPLHERARDRRRWALLARSYLGRSWLDVPWYWAEAYFYRRMLEAVRYFQPGAWQRKDPFAAKKQPELAERGAQDQIDAQLATAPADAGERFGRFLQSSLWGNRLDLSHDVSVAHARHAPAADERVNLLVDDTHRVWEYLSSRAPGRVILVADNAGGELLADLALADLLLTRRLASQVELHVKPQPFFVSDATAEDVDAAREALLTSGQHAVGLARRLTSYLDEERLAIATHWFYTSPLCFPDLPRGLHADYQRAALVIVKGDANYRRLLSDAHWPPTAAFAEVTGYFPTSLVALRTLKAELIVGLEAGRAQRLAAEDPTWLVNGRRGMVQARLAS